MFKEVMYFVKEKTKGKVDTEMFCFLFFMGLLICFVFTFAKGFAFGLATVFIYISFYLFW